jgi:hypothetical protein
MSLEKLEQSHEPGELLMTPCEAHCLVFACDALSAPASRCRAVCGHSAESAIHVDKIVESPQAWKWRMCAEKKATTLMRDRPTETAKRNGRADAKSNSSRNNRKQAACDADAAYALQGSQSWKEGLRA